MFTRKTIRRAGLFLILLLSIFLRLYRLGAQSLWADEMSSLVTAIKPVPRLLYDISHEIHPPFYHLMLKGWISVFGISEAGIRFMSAFFGVILVLLTYAIGRRLLGERVGLAAAFFSAISPFQVYYSQEARMYMPLAALSALSIYCLVRFLETESQYIRDRMLAAGYWELEDGYRIPEAGYQRPDTKYRPSDNLYLWASFYVLATAACLYIHYSFPIILLMENLVYGLWLLLSWQKGWVIQRILRWGAIQMATIALYWPWLPIAYRQVSTWPSISQPHSPAFIVQEAFRLFSLGHSIEPQNTRWMMMGFALIFLVGLWPGRWAAVKGRDYPLPRPVSYLLVLLYCLFPIFMMCVLSLLRPAFRPKFFLVGTSAFSIALARGVFTSWDLAMSDRKPASGVRYLASGLWTVTCSVFVVAVSAYSLGNYYFDGRYARDDYRGIAHYIETHESEGDAIILNASGQKDVFSYYYRGRSPLYPLPQGRPLNEVQTRHDLETIAAAHDRVFALFWATDESDPNRFIESWLDARAYKAMDSWYGTVRLVVYALLQEPSSMEIQHPLRTVLGERARLLGYNLLTEEVRVGDILPLTLFWEALAPFEERYAVFIHVLDEDDHIVGQRDTEPGGGAAVTTGWQVGQVLVDNYGVLIRPGTPPGHYRIEVGMYSLDSGQRLSVSQGEGAGEDRVLLEPIRVLRPQKPPATEALAMQHQDNIAYGEVMLLGYDLYQVGYEHQPDKPLHPGDALRLNFYWQAIRQPQTDWRLSLQLINEEGHTWAAQEGWPAGQGYPTTLWQSGEVVRGQHDILIPAEAPSGRYYLRGQFTSPQGEALQPLWRSEPFTVK